MERRLLPQTGRSDRILHRLDVRHRWIVVNSAETNSPKQTEPFRAVNPPTIAANFSVFFHLKSPPEPIGLSRLCGSYTW